ncbi:site-specific integrase, partial [Craurococcus roseus]|uniref:hypothetical protein n=1 Tax=Craurococcus roseus TaxID=77585 RepID=UPI0031D053A2
MQRRTHAILTTAHRFGLRSGETLGLKTRDFRQSDDPATLTVHRRHDDPEDPRADQPVAKTLPRVLEFEDDHRGILALWIMEHRSDRERFSHARRHPFLFVNRTGRPLGNRGYEKIYAALRGRHPSLGPLVNHGKRQPIYAAVRSMVKFQG